MEQVSSGRYAISKQRNVFCIVSSDKMHVLSLAITTINFKYIVARFTSECQHGNVSA